MIENSKKCVNKEAEQRLKAFFDFMFSAGQQRADGNFLSPANYGFLQSLGFCFGMFKDRVIFFGYCARYFVIVHARSLVMLVNDEDEDEAFLFMENSLCGQWHSWTS